MAMQKQLKIIDKELDNNDLIRIPDTTQKQQNSIFRALSMAIYYSHKYYDQVITEIKLTLITNLQEKRNNSYPIVHDNFVLKKYILQSQLILDFFNNPDLSCFHNDVLTVASAIFGKTICVYTIDKEEYLNQMYISACKNPSKQRISLAKVGKKYFAVLNTHVYEILPFIKQSIDQMINELPEQQNVKDLIKEDKVHYPNYDEIVQNNRKGKLHKKSLSDCGQLPLEKQVTFQDSIKDYHQEIPIYKGFPQESINYNKSEEEYFDNYSMQTYGMQNIYNQQQLANYYNYNYGHYIIPQQQNYKFMEQQSMPLHNERYTGRLKFFDQSGNYGFIVIDNLNCDLFVHYDDLSKAGIGKQKLLSIKNHLQLRLQFTYYEYEGKQHKKSKKAIDVISLLIQ